MLEKTTRLILLYDFYQDLLTEKQKQFIELYFQDDLSLGEIAEETGISRQAVYEHIKRAETLLEDYEEKLELLEKFEKRNQIIKELLENVEQIEDHNGKQLREKILLLKQID